jgi:hypothetical protein
MEIKLMPTAASATKRSQQATTPLSSKEPRRPWREPPPAARASGEDLLDRLVAEHARTLSRGARSRRPGGSWKPARTQALIAD